MPGRRLTPRPRWTPGQRRALERSHSAGKLEAVSAQKVGRSASAVKAKIARLGLSRNPADPRQGDLMAGSADPNTESSSREDDHAEAHHRQRSARRPAAARPILYCPIPAGSRSFCLSLGAPCCRRSLVAVRLAAAAKQPHSPSA